jgi:uncharacterized protein YxjI
MRLFLTQCTAAGDARFLVLDELGKIRFRVTQRGNSAGSFAVMDESGLCVARILQKSLLKYVRGLVTLPGSEPFTVAQNLGAKPALRIGGWNVRVRGDFLQRNFDLLDPRGNLIMTHCPRWGVWGDGYEVTVAEPGQAVCCLCVAVCVDAVASGGEGIAAPAN